MKLLMRWKLVGTCTGAFASCLCGAVGFQVDAGGRVPFEPGKTKSKDWADFSFTVNGLVGDVKSVKLNLDMVHSHDPDLEIWLYSPSGVGIPLFNQLLGKPAVFENFDDTLFSDEAGGYIDSGVAPYRGAFRPQEPLNAFNSTGGNGTWKLRIFDRQYGDYGYLYRAGDAKFESRRGPLSGTYIDVVAEAVPDPWTLPLAAAALLVAVDRRRRQSLLVGRVPASRNKELFRRKAH